MATGENKEARIMLWATTAPLNDNLDKAAEINNKIWPLALH